LCLLCSPTHSQGSRRSLSSGPPSSPVDREVSPSQSGYSWPDQLLAWHLSALNNILTQRNCHCVQTP
ncbi:hypothetical protein STEG23_035404, partial [Scotinomys teguina]